MSYLLGHLNVTTTNRYVRPNQRAAEAALLKVQPDQKPDRRKKTANSAKKS